MARSISRVVSNCYLYSACNAIRIGCPSDDTVRNAVFRDLVLEGHNGIASEMPTWYLNPGCNGSFVSWNILFERCWIKTDNQPIRLSVSEGVRPADFGHMTFRDISLESEKPIRTLSLDSGWTMSASWRTASEGDFQQWKNR